MKVLIWFVVLFVYGVIASQFRLGALPTVLLYTGTFFLAKFLCAKWDVKVFEKEASKRGMEPEEYASSIFPHSLLERLEASKDNRSMLKKILKQSIEDKKITKSDANVLFDMFFVSEWN